MKKKGTGRSGKTDPMLTKLRRICLALPDTEETPTWGKPHFRVANKIFCGYGEERDRPSIGFKLEMEHAAAIVEDPRFRRAPYVGHKGWVSMDATAIRDWDDLRDLILESYRLIAPKRSLARLETEEVRAPAARKRPTRKPAARKAARRKS